VRLLPDEGPDFDAWVIARRSALLRTAWLLTADAGLAEDLVQSALERCWPRWRRIRKMADVDAYVRKVLLNTYLSSWRRRWRGELPTGRLPELEAHEPDLLDREPLVRALRRLSAGQRAVVVLRFADDLSEARTAELLGCSVGTVKSQSFRGLRALRADPILQLEADLT
jgi:RNA polymerase sigma-70 factor (sigma-E family)